MCVSSLFGEVSADVQVAIDVKRPDLEFEIFGTRRERDAVTGRIIGEGGVLSTHLDLTGALAEDEVATGIPTATSHLFISDLYGERNTDDRRRTWFG